MLYDIIDPIIYKAVSYKEQYNLFYKAYSTNDDNTYVYEFWKKSAVKIVKRIKMDSFILIKKGIEKEFDLSSFITKMTTSDNDMMRVFINDNTEKDKLKELFSFIWDKCEEEYKAKPFGCCSRYVACSDALKCIHPDKKIAKGCQYKKNLDAGKIFYGINANN